MNDEITNPSSTRRQILTGAAQLALSAGAVSLLGAVAPARGTPAADGQDARILNVAVGLEYEGINAYGIALKSGLLGANAAKAATKFRDDHRRHNDLLIATIRKLGGEPVTQKAESDYVKSLGLDRLTDERGVLELARNLELGAANAYLGVIGAFSDPDLAKVSGRLAADEASHFALINFDLGRPFHPALGFGA
jgi:rubrerythrin